MGEARGSTHLISLMLICMCYASTHLFICKVGLGFKQVVLARTESEIFKGPGVFYYVITSNGSILLQHVMPVCFSKVLRSTELSHSCCRCEG